jgi:glycosyltransferase involved in cell wall biosynthesis
VKAILIFAYYSYKDPIFQSAVLPYFTDFPDKDRYRFILLTFEQERFQLTAPEQERLKKELAAQQITWIANRWHSGRFKVLKKVYDLLAGVSQTLRLAKKYKVAAIYSEGFPGAVIAHYVARLTRRPHIVHSFEPHTDYMVESGIWSETNWEARALRRFEGIVGRHAAALLTATQAFIDKWKGKTRAQLYRVPSCVDLEHFQFTEDGRQRLRAQYGISEREVVVVYLGKLGGMYMEDELFEFFQELNSKRTNDRRVRIMLLSSDAEDKIALLIQQSGIAPDRFIVESLTRNQVPAYLSAADIAISAVRPNPSKRFCSPIKHGEYWACGLPVIIPDGISDDYLLAETYKIGWRLPALNKEAYQETLTRVFNEWSRNEQAGYRQRARDFVLKDRNVKAFQKLYHEVFSQL